MISFPDYDIGGCRLVWTACFRLVPASTTATAAPLWQLGGNGVPDPVGAPRLLPNNISPCPRIRVDAGQFAHQPVALFGGPGAAPDALHQFGVALAKARGLHCPKRLPQRRVILRHFRTRRRRPLRPRRLLPARRAAAIRAVPGVMGVGPRLAGRRRTVA